MTEITPLPMIMGSVVVLVCSTFFRNLPRDGAAGSLFLIAIAAAEFILHPSFPRPFFNSALSFLHASVNAGD